MAPLKPDHFKKLVVTKAKTNFRDAVSIETTKMCHPKDNEVCIKIRYVGINAMDIKVSVSHFFDPRSPPFDIGYEGIGEVVEVGKEVTNINIGQSVAFGCHKAFAEYVCVVVDNIHPIPEINPEYLGIFLSGLTAAIGLDKVGHITEGETVLITAAAGGTGHIAVQWAKAAGCHVIGTCSSQKKCEFLKELGCDRIINYKEEDMEQVLTKEYPNGIDVIWETIGGKIFQVCANHLAIKGRLLLVGAISEYKNQSPNFFPEADLSNLLEILFSKSAALLGFCLLHYRECYSTYFKYLCENVEKKRIRSVTDLGKTTLGKELHGLEGIIEGVEHLQSAKNIGKVIVQIC